MKDTKLNRNIVIFIFIVVLLLQIIAIVYSTSKREYYHIDEYYSHGLMQYERAFIFDNEDFTDNWHDKEYYTDYLTIDENEKFDFSSIYKNQAEDVHPPLYYLLLRLACSFNIGEFSIWPGTILNIVLFIISSVFLFLIAKEIFKNPFYALLVCFVNGFSLATIETVMYVRMYQLLILNILMLIYWHIRKAHKEKLSLKDLLPLYFIVILGFLTHYYYCIIAIILFIMYITRYLKQKQTTNAFKYVVTLMVSALTGMLIFPYSIMHIFFSYRGKEVGSNLLDFSTMLYKIKENISLINIEVFHGYGYVVLALAFILCVCWMFLKKKVTMQKENNHNIRYVAIPMVIYLVIAVICSPYSDLRYLMPAIPLIFCSLIYGFKDILQDIVNNRKVLCILTMIAVIFATSVIPNLSNNLYTYEGHRAVLNYLETNSNKPMIYIYDIFSVQYNKIMECYEALTKPDKSYIMSTKNCSIENIKNVLDGVDMNNGYFMMMHFEYVEDILGQMYKEGLYTTGNYIGKLGRYRIYELKKEI